MLINNSSGFFHLSVKIIILSHVIADNWEVETNRYLSFTWSLSKVFCEKVLIFSRILLFHLKAIIIIS